MKIVNTLTGEDVTRQAIERMKLRLTLKANNLMPRTLIMNKIK